MISYNDKEHRFEILMEAYEQYIDEQFERSKSWSKLQLGLIVETLANFINTVFEIYQHYPGNIIDLFEKMAVINALQQDINNQFTKELTNKFHGLNIIPIDDLLEYMSRPLKWCKGFLGDSKLNKQGRLQ